MLSPLDWIIIISFLLLSLGIGIYYRKNASKSISDFFLGGRNLPWYIAGISMVATTFAADTPLAVSELVAQGGIAKNWLWWSFLFGGALTIFFFAHLWRRSGVLTELEFITLRYDGKPARFLRSFKAVYLGLFINAIVIAWVNIAMTSLQQAFFDVDYTTAIYYTYGMMLLAVLYASLSGLKGVAITDTVQFIIAMVGCIILAIIVVNSEDIGGITNLKSKLPEEALRFFPSIGSGDSPNSMIHGFGLTIGAFLAFIGVQWWASWYPGAEPGGGGYIAQRMMSTKSEKDAVWATILFQIGHYCIRPWPWIVVGLCAIVLYSGEYQPSDQVLKEKLIQAEESGIASFDDLSAQHPELIQANPQLAEYHYRPRMGFVFVMKDYLPNGLRGLLLVAFIAAYLSTISTQVNWGASYLVNDLIKPLQPQLEEAELVKYSRIASVFVMIAGAIVTPMVDSISGVWAFLMNCGAGLGLVLILRWYWWRINAWSEITATITPLFVYGFCHFYLNDKMGASFTEKYGPFYVTVLITTVTWIMVSFITKPTSKHTLSAFIKQVQPQGVWPVLKDTPNADNSGLIWSFLSWISMLMIIIGFLFGTGSLILLNTQEAMGYYLLTIIGVFSIRFFLKKTNIFERNS